MSWRNKPIVLFCCFLLVLILVSCKKTRNENYLILNNAAIDVRLEKYLTTILLEDYAIPKGSSYEESSGKFKEGYGSVFPAPADSLIMTFEDGKKLIFYDSTLVWNDSLSDYIWIKPRLSGVNGEQFYPVEDIGNILRLDAWEVNCDGKRNETCDFRFEITERYYDLSK